MNKKIIGTCLVVMQLANHAYAKCPGCVESSTPKNFSTSQATAKISKTIDKIKTTALAYKRLLGGERNIIGVTDANAETWSEVLSATNCAESMGVNATMGIAARAFCLYRADMTGVMGYEITYNGPGSYICHAYTDGAYQLNPLELISGHLVNTTPRLRTASETFSYQVYPEPPAAGTEVDFICATFSEGLSTPQACDPNQLIYAPI